MQTKGEIQIYVHGANYGRHPQGAVFALDEETARKELALCSFAIEPYDRDDIVDAEGRRIPSRKAQLAAEAAQERRKTSDQHDALRRIREENDREAMAAQAARSEAQARQWRDAKMEGNAHPEMLIRELREEMAGLERSLRGDLQQSVANMNQLRDENASLRALLDEATAREGAARADATRLHQELSTLKTEPAKGKGR